MFFLSFILGASKKFAMVIEGESLLNDGAAIVLYNIFLRLVTSSSVITGMICTVFSH